MYRHQNLGALHTRHPSSLFMRRWSPARGVLQPQRLRAPMPTRHRPRALAWRFHGEHHAATSLCGARSRQLGRAGGLDGRHGSAQYVQYGSYGVYSMYSGHVECACTVRIVCTVCAACTVHRQYSMYSMYRSTGCTVCTNSTVGTVCTIFTTCIL